ncbi:N-acetylneuraminate synthase family protein [Candidatus Pelagibacter sp.]|uniref:N-acetylneuraminate synthase family protein n=1 Tax=Candidatus Pelagibacter sp. TaxID=2024849 RepID=UPI003F843156
MRNINFKNLKKTFLIAEIGNNHEGDIKTAKKLISQAAKAKVDAVKFQTFITEDFINNQDKKRFKLLKKFELNQKQFLDLKKFAHKNKLLFISTPLDIKSSDFLIKNADIIKIASSDNNFFPMFDKIIKSKKNVIISTGLINIEQINYIKKKIYKLVGKKKAHERIAFLHCVTSYPVNYKYANLNSIRYLKEKLKFAIGYSDHTLGIDASITATSLGAKIIEKHFTINKKYSNFRDHMLSADLNELKKMVLKIRKIELLLGKYEKNIQNCEKNFLKIVRRSPFAKEDIKKGEKFSLKNVNFLRDEYSKNFYQLDGFIGKRSNKFIKKHQKITLK